MKLSLFRRLAMAMFASLALGLGMTACGGGTIGYMWVLGQQYNQIVGFKIDDYTGNLTNVQGSPFGSNGNVPVSIVVKPGGRYVYVINQGTCPSSGCGTATNTSQTVALYSVGGDGTLTFQQQYVTQGYNSMWAQFDSTGTYLYVLDKYSPSRNTNATGATTYTGPNTDGNGSITVFLSDSNTGRLSLVTNAQTQYNSVNTPFWEVGPKPIMMKTLSGCLFTVNSGNQTISPYVFGTSGQLGFTTTQTFPLTTGNVTSINGSGSLLYLTDASQTPGVIVGYTVGSSCALTTVNGGNKADSTGTANPTYSFIDSTNKYLYVLNSSTTSTTSTTPFSSVSVFTINTTNQELQEVSGSPFTVGSGPVCMVEDPTNQYLYTSNHNDGTVTGKRLDPNTGLITVLPRGSTFTATGEASCLAVSGATI
ncbi:lactonase family protein [Granulicella paludicola]|uniref:lactonase family protein n=1 Tax=Granulicella paludicola TaxID=474951 RepID=UPI0021E06733|nr:lactonase family protein [Granulicella paludicola]